MKNHILTNYNRAISAIYSVPTFKEVFKRGHSDYVIEKITKYRTLIGAKKGAQIRNVLKKAYTHLTLNYRNEYVYKNTIANKLLLELHDLNEAGIINELRAGNSIADIVIVNGTNTIYEIKTELDSPDKLKKQIEDYRKISPKIYLVTHHSLVEKYASMLKDDSVGLVSLSTENDFLVIMDAIENPSQLNNKVMMNTLRKDEYSAIIHNFYGVVPQVSNIRFYKECQRLVDQIDPMQFHKFMLIQLRKRMLLEKQMIRSVKTPFELKHICLCQNPTKFEYENLYRFLTLSV